MSDLPIRMIASDIDGTLIDTLEEMDGYARFGAGFHDWRGIAVGGVAGATDLD